MELSELRIFIAIAENGSAIKTAKQLAMTQPGVSQHLAKLEDELGKRLFDRNGRKLQINDFGLEFLERAKKVVNDADALTTISKGAYCPIGSLKLGLIDSATITIVPSILAKFKKAYPGVNLDIDVSDSNDIENGVLRGRFELGIITSGQRTHPQIDMEVLYNERIDAIVSKHHPLAKQRRVTLEKLAQYPIFSYSRNSRTRRLIDDVFHANNIHPKDVMDVYFNSGAGRLAEAGLGVALLSQAFITGEMQKHRCVHLRIEKDPFQRAICLIRKRNVNLSDAARSFYEMIMAKRK